MSANPINKSKSLKPLTKAEISAFNNLPNKFWDYQVARPLFFRLLDHKLIWSEPNLLCRKVSNPLF